MGVVLHCSNRYLFTGAEGGSVSVWAASSGELVHTLRDGGGGGVTGSTISGIAVSGGGKVIISHNNG